MDTIKIHYRLTPDNGPEINFNLHFSEDDCLFSTELPETCDDWTKLEFHQCSNCSLNVETSERCPVAVNLQGIINQCDIQTSYDQVYVEVSLPDRQVSLNTTMQRALSSLLGLVMATSDCSHLAFLRPMARYHMPLASDQETIIRSVSTYLLFQYFKVRDGKQVDMELSGLVEIYRQLQHINSAMASRLRAASEQDVASNAVVLLDLFAKTVPYSIEDSLEDVRHLFNHELFPFSTSSTISPTSRTD